MGELREVVVGTDPTRHGALVGHVGDSEFAVGGPYGAGEVAAGPNPYDLLSASLAACTAMTVRFQAGRRQLPLEGVEVGVSFHHGAEGGRDSFEHTLVLHGDLDDQQRTWLLEAANLCPVGKILGISADIRTSLAPPAQAARPGRKPVTRMTWPSCRSPMWTQIELAPGR